MNVTNDTFYIWHSGKYATINGHRLGKLTTQSTVDWQEINAALGCAALLLLTVAENPRNDLKFSGWKILAAGSFSKICKVEADDKTLTTYNLYTDGSFSLFGKRSFNSALRGLLCCLSDASQYVTEHDRTMQLPYPVEVDKRGEMLIGGLTICLGGDDEAWTRALKFFLSDLKWLVAFCAKHVDG